MSTSESQKKASIKYAKEHLKRVPFDLPIEYYESVKKLAVENGYSVNGFIKEALQEKIERLAKN